MSFVPPLFSKFGKTASDLLNQKFDAKKDDFKHQASIKSQANNVTVTASVISETTANDKLTGKLNVKYEDKAFGDVTAEWLTSSKLKLSSKLSKLARGLIVNVEAEQDLTGKVGSEFVRESFAGSLEYNNKKDAVLASAAVGIEGFSVGAAANVALAKLKEGGAAIDFGAQYEDGNLIGTVIVENGGSIGGSIFHRVNSDLQLAYKLVATCKSGSSLALGAQYKLNPATVTKGKVLVFSDQTYVLAGYLSHKLSNPNATVAFSNQWASSNPTASQFGVNVSFGDI